jgi:hypothetical protein
MKKLLFLFSVVLITAAGCKDEPSSTTPQPTNNASAGDLEGRWNYVSIEAKDGAMFFDGTPTGTYTSTSKDMTGFLEFKSDGTYEQDVQYTQVLTTTVLGQSTTEEFPVPRVMVSGESYTYNSTNSTVEIVSPGQTINYTITELTSTKLAMQYDVKTEQVTPQGTVVSQATVMAEFSK